MTLLNCPTNGDKNLIIDTSVAINLNATQFSEDIINAFGAQFVMPEIAYGELSPEYDDQSLVSTLIEDLYQFGKWSGFKDFR